MKSWLSGKLRETLSKGKIGRGDKRKQNYINISVLAGFVMLFIWQAILYKNIFIPIGVIWALVLIPSAIAAFFLYRKYLLICGYTENDDIAHKILMRFLVFLLVAMPIGNASALGFMLTNNLLADETVKSVKIKPAAVELREGKRGNIYTSFEITLDGITKSRRMNGNHTGVLENKTVLVNVRNGFFGYSVTVGGYKIE